MSSNAILIEIQFVRILKLSLTFIRMIEWCVVIFSKNFFCGIQLTAYELVDLVKVKTLKKLKDSYPTLLRANLVACLIVRNANHRTLSTWKIITMFTIPVFLSHLGNLV